MRRCRELTFVCLVVVALCSWSFPMVEGTSGNQVLTNGTIVFAPLPTDAQEGFVPATYDARGLDGYYSMSNGFTDVVRSGTLPYDIIIPLTQDVVNGNQINTGSVVDMVLRWYAPILALTILGVLFAICMPLCCCVTCCCRCCNQCGADLTWSIDKEEKEGSRRCVCWVELVIVVLLCILVGVGMVFAFLTNQAIKDTIDNIVPTIDSTLDEAEAFANDTVTELNFLNGQFNFTVETVINQTSDLQSSVVGPLLDMHLPAFNQLLEDVLDLGNDFQAVNSSLVAVNSNITALNSTAQNISNQLEVLRMELMNLRTTCMGSALFVVMPTACDGIPDPGSIPDVTAGLSELNDAVDVINQFEDSLAFADNLTMIVNQVNTTFHNALNNITAAAQNQTQVVADTIDPIRSTTSNTLNSFLPAIEQFFNGDPNDNPITVQTARNFISENVVNPALPYSLPNLSLARWVFGLFFCITVALTLLAIVGGLFCGLVGSSNRRLPYERTKLSNCGGVSLLASVYLIFLTCFVLFILAAILFPFGTTLRKFCQAVEDPEYEVFGQIVDNEDLWGGTTLVNFLIPDNVLVGGQRLDLNLSVQTVFQMCEMNQPLWQAVQADQIIGGINIDISGQTVNLGNLVNNPSTLLDTFNLTGLIASATSSIGDISIDAADLIPRDQIDSIRSTLPSELTFGTGLIGTVNGTLMTASMNLTAASEQLAVIVNVSQMANEDNLTAQAMDVNDTIQTIQVLIQTAMMQLGELDGSVMAAEAAAQSALNATDGQINATLDRIPVLVMNVTDSLPTVIEGFVNTTIGFVNQFLDYTVQTLRNEAIPCGPLSNIYVGAINLVCRQNLNSLNGFWFALGWCALFFIPLAFFLIALSKHFRQHKDVDEILRTTEYPEYQLETYYNVNAASEVMTNQSPQMGTAGRFSKNPDGYPSMLDDPRNGHDDLWLGNDGATLGL